MLWKRHLRTALVMVLMAWSAGPASASPTSASPTPPALDEVYRELQKFLNAFVFETGPSMRGSIMARHETNSRIIKSAHAETRFEGNRVAYADIEPEYQRWLTQIRGALEAHTHDLDLKVPASAEGLALWLNLRTVAVIERMIVLRPKGKMDAEDLTFILDEDCVRAGDRFVTVRQIDDFIVRTWNTPMVLYGLHDGTLGSPNVLARVHKPQSVMRNLDMNAYEFTNSMRGLQFRRNTTRVADFYARFADYFGWTENPDALVAHISGFATANLVERMQDNEKLKYMRPMLWPARLLTGELSSNASFITAGRPTLGQPGQETPWAARAFELYQHTWNKFLRPGYRERHATYLNWMQNRSGSVTVEEFEEGAAPDPSTDDAEEAEAAASDESKQ